jgi:hypothetical protein
VVLTDVISRSEFLQGISYIVIYIRGTLTSLGSVECAVPFRVFLSYVLYVC